MMIMLVFVLSCAKNSIQDCSYKGTKEILLENPLSILLTKTPY